ncbi:MAG: hypothetical protein E6X32_01590 [Varibaculum cambriense]|uniref:hypothetical protein n=1 Tax=Varibaculum cambriense TaxID=184870 RepID=UPI002914B4F7|nr:hypothetical protein [Varibaculum cambriense]MDU4944288.1 hypothetical protein [Varibaculum cambriense]
MTKTLLAFIAVAAMLSSPVLLIMNQMYVAATFGVTGVILAVGLLLNIGDGKHG